jgi:hypothetical protein
MRRAGHKKPSRLLRPALFDWFEVKSSTSVQLGLIFDQLEELLRTTIRWKNSNGTAPGHGDFSFCTVIEDPNWLF